MKLEVYFDYACPFCLRGHDQLLALLPAHPALEVDWRPCEAHPRPEVYGRHSDLCARGMYIVAELGGDVTAYHQRMYRAAVEERVDIEDQSVIAGIAGELVDRAAFLRRLEAGAYQEELDGNNNLTWGTHRFDAVPSLVLGSRKLGSVPGVGLTPQAMARFLTENA